MDTRYRKIIISWLIFILSFTFLFGGVNYCLALTTGIDKAFNTNANSPLDATAVQGAGYNNKATFSTILGTILTMVLGLIGVIFLILAFAGGYTWMMAGGNEEKVGEAKKTIEHAIIGIVIVLSAYVISRFIVEVLGGIVFKVQS